MSAPQKPGKIMPAMGGGMGMPGMPSGGAPFKKGGMVSKKKKK